MDLRGLVIALMLIGLKIYSPAIRAEWFTLMTQSPTFLYMHGDSNTPTPRFIILKSKSITNLRDNYVICDD